MTTGPDTMSWQREEFRQVSGGMDGNSHNCREGDRRTTNEGASGSSDFCRFRTDCNSCMLVETGEKANYLGLPCESCGRPPRSPYPLHSTPTKTTKKKEKFFPMVKKHMKSFMKVSKKKDFENVGKEDHSQDELYEKTNVEHFVSPTTTRKEMQNFNFGANEKLSFTPQRMRREMEYTNERAEKVSVLTRFSKFVKIFVQNSFRESSNTQVVDQRVNRFRVDCHSCMLVETGEKASYLGLACGDCGRVPRSPYHGYF